MDYTKQRHNRKSTLKRRIQLRSIKRFLMDFCLYLYKEVVLRLLWFLHVASGQHKKKQKKKKREKKLDRAICNSTLPILDCFLFNSPSYWLNDRAICSPLELWIPVLHPDIAS